jgi:hypothetical protein
MTTAEREAGHTSLHNIHANFDNRLVEEDELKGEEYIKAPTIAVKEKVLKYEGGKRALLPEEEIANSTAYWNFTPVTIDHPTDRGRNLSATQPDVMDESVVGLFMNARFDAKKSALKGDVYLNKKWLNQHRRGGEILERIESGDVLEVSTAYRAPGAESTTGTFNGDNYNVVQREIRPNHFALLLDKPGRCSLEDGCGFPRVNSDSEVNAWEYDEEDCCDNCEEGHICEDVLSNALNEAREVSFDGTETREEQQWGEVDKSMEAYWEGFISETDFEGSVDNPPDSYQDAPTEFKQWQVEKNFLGETFATTWRGARILPVVNPLTNQLSEGGLIAAKAAARGARGATFAPQQAESVVNAVNELLVDNFDFSEEDFEQENNSMEDIPEEEAKTLFTKLKETFGFGESVENSQDDELESDSNENEMDEENDEQVEASEEEEADLKEENEDTVESEESAEDDVQAEDSEDSTIEVDKNELVDIVSETVEEKLNESEAVAAVQNSVENQRKELEERIVSNSKLSEETVEKMDNEELYQLERSLSDDHYGVRPNDVDTNSDNSNKATSPPSFFDQNKE